MFPFDIDESDTEDNSEQVIDDDFGESEEENKRPPTISAYANFENIF